jgi:hypothetical protein
MNPPGRSKQDASIDVLDPMMLRFVCFVSRNWCRKPIIVSSKVSETACWMANECDWKLLGMCQMLDVKLN